MTETTVSAVRMSGKLPSGDLNGLSDLAKDLVSDQDKRRVIVAAVDVQSVKHIRKKHLDVPTVEFYAVEAITNPEARQAVLDAMSAAYQERTGKNELPLDGDPDGDDEGDGDGQK